MLAPPSPKHFVFSKEILFFSIKIFLHLNLCFHFELKSFVIGQKKTLKFGKWGFENKFAIRRTVGNNQICYE